MCSHNALRFVINFIVAFYGILHIAISEIEMEIEILSARKRNNAAIKERNNCLLQPAEVAGRSTGGQCE